MYCQTNANLPFMRRRSITGVNDTAVENYILMIDWRHYLAVIQRKPGALRNGAPFAEMPAAFRQHQDLMLPIPGGDREMVDILALVLHHDEQAVLTAVEKA